MASKLDTRQSIHRASLTQLGLPASSELDNIVSGIDTDLNQPLRMYATFPTADAKLNFSNSKLTMSDGGKKVVTPVEGTVKDALTGLFINFQTQAVSNAADFDITFPASTVGQFRRCGFTLLSNGKIKANFSAEFALEASLPDAGTLIETAGLPIGYIDLECTNVLGYFKTAGSSTSIIENTKIYRFGAGGGGGGGAFSILAVSSNITLVDKTTHLVDTSAARSLTLPTPVEGLRLEVKDKTGQAATNNITIVRAGAEEIDGVAASFVIEDNWASITLVSDGVDWFII